MDSAELLVARHHLACLAVHLLKDGEIAHQVEQVCRAQHAGHQHLLAVQMRAAVQPCRALLCIAEEERRAHPFCLFRPEHGQFVRRFLLLGRRGQHTQLLGHRAHGHRAGVGPFQIRLWRRTDGGSTGLEEVAGDQELVGVEQTLDTLVLGVERRKKFSALIRVAQELVDGLLQRILDARALELCHHQRDAVHEQHGIRDDMPAPAGQLHLELVDDEEVVVCRVLEINEPHRLRTALLPVGQTIGDRALEQQLCRRLVDLHQPMPGCLLQSHGWRGRYARRRAMAGHRAD